jgi:hypothetical protein
MNQIEFYKISGFDVKFEFLLLLGSFFGADWLISRTTEGFLIVLNTTDERNYSEFWGLLQDGFRILQIFLHDVSARCRQRTGTDSMRKTVGPTCVGW